MQERVGYLLSSVAGFTGYVSCSVVRDPHRPIPPGESYGSDSYRDMRGRSEIENEPSPGPHLERKQAANLKPASLNAFN